LEKGVLYNPYKNVKLKLPRIGDSTELKMKNKNSEIQKSGKVD
jgi:hypothetical protein